MESDAQGIFMTASSLKIESGGKFEAVRLTLQCHTIEIDQSGLLDLSNKVRHLPVFGTFALLLCR